MQFAGMEDGEYFILTKEGQLYTITEKNMNSNNFEPIKDAVLGKVLKIGRFSRTYWSDMKKEGKKINPSHRGQP